MRLGGGGGLDDALGVDGRLDGLRGDAAGPADVGNQAAPEVVQQLLELLAVLRAHVRPRERLDVRLVLADARHLDADAVLLEGARVEDGLAREARHEDHPVGVDDDLVRRRGEVVVPGRRVVDVGHDGLAGGPEIGERGAHLPECGVAGARTAWGTGFREGARPGSCCRGRRT